MTYTSNNPQQIAKDLLFNRRIVNPEGRGRAPKLTSEEIGRQIAEFKANGGKIQVLESEVAPSMKRKALPTVGWAIEPGVYQ